MSVFNLDFEMLSLYYDDLKWMKYISWETNPNPHPTLTPTLTLTLTRYISWETNPNPNPKPTPTLTLTLTLTSNPTPSPDPSQAARVYAGEAARWQRALRSLWSERLQC